MKHPNPIDKQGRFHGQLRHYHRSGPSTNRTWDEWIEGKANKSGSIRWLKIVLIALAVLGLGAIIAGLYIELK